MKIIKWFLGLFRRPIIRARMEYGGSFVDEKALSRIDLDSYSIDRHLDDIYDKANKLAYAECFVDLDNTLLIEFLMIRGFLADKEDDLLLGWLIATLPCKSHLQNREPIMKYLREKGVDVSGL